MFIKHPGMKKITLMVMILLTASLAGAQKAWQKITDKAIRELTFDFKIPPPEYGMILWWGWDGHMSDTVIKRDLDRIFIQTDLCATGNYIIHPPVICFLML